MLHHLCILIVIFKQVERLKDKNLVTEVQTNHAPVKGKLGLTTKIEQ